MSTTGHPPTFAVDDVTMRFGSTIALDSLSVDFAAGTSSALVGSNGSGKTTLLRLLAGLIEPTSGRIERTATGCAFVRQLPMLHPWLPLRVIDVLLMGRYRERGLFGRLRREDRELAEHAADRLSISSLRKRQLGELSGGQRQRVLVAQALVQQADVLLLDEPTTGLDIPSRDIILDVVRHEADAGRTVVLSTHDLDDAAVADQVVLLAGRLVGTGPPTEVLVPELLGQVFEAVRVLGTRSTLIVDDHGHGTHSHGP